MRRIFFIFVLVNIASTVFASDMYKYWIQFTDKDNTTYSLDTPSEYLSERSIDRRIKYSIPIDSFDLPVNQHYVDSVVSKGAAVCTRSKWLNGITIQVSDTSVIPSIDSLDCVENIELSYIPNYLRKTEFESEDLPKKRVSQTNDGYGNAYAQINMLNGDWLHQAGYRGEGVQLAVIDVGFLNVDAISAYSQAFNNGQILGTKDFVNPSSDFYSTHFHGEEVLSVMAAYEYNTYIGTAPEASYWLIRTEDENTEFPVEGDNFIAAMEFADSVGVDIITSSLGYYNFDDPSMNFTYEDMDGQTCRISKGTSFVNRKGMIFITSAGNQGSNPWHYITTPADADSILVVGAVTETLERSSFSSYGPTSDGRIRPTIAALGSNTAVINSDGDPSVDSGTSMACPIIAGLTACLWQSLPDLSSTEIMNLIIENSSQHLEPDNEIGYGITDFYAAYVQGAGINKVHLAEQNKIKIYPNPANDGIHIEVDQAVFNDKLELFVFSLSGKEVLSEKIKKPLTMLPLTTIKQGIYTVIVRSKEKVLFRDKLIKKK